MANHDFTDPIQEEIVTKRDYRKQLTQQSGQLVSQLTVFKSTFDTLHSMSTEEEQVILDAKFLEFKLDAKKAIGL